MVILFFEAAFIDYSMMSIGIVFSTTTKEARIIQSILGAISSMDRWGTNSSWMKFVVNKI
jgi:hypothetical protein